MGLALLVAVAVPCAASVQFSPYLSYSLPLSLLFAGASVMMFFLHRFKHYGAIFLLVIGIAAGTFFYTSRVVLPLVNPYRSARFLCGEIASIIQPGEKLATFRLETGPYNYYAGIVPISEFEDDEDLSNFLKCQERVFCLITVREVDRIQSKVELSMVKLVDEHRLRYKDVLLISNR